MAAEQNLKCGILVEFNVEDIELLYPLYRLREHNVDTFIIGPYAAGFKYRLKNGINVKADKSIDDVKAEDLDLLIVPGGVAPDYWRRDERFLKLVADVSAQGKLIATICHGPSLLISAKILRDRHVTCWVSIKDDVENAGCRYTDEPVVVDPGADGTGVIISSRKPDDLPDFCRAIVNTLAQSFGDRFRKD